MIKQGIDCYTPIKASVAARLAAEGYRFACRYLVPAGYSKRLTKSEAQILTDAGLQILCVYETTANRTAGGAPYGKSDGAKALACAQEIGMPASGCIYFAADYDAGSKDYNAIEAYLRAAKEQVGKYKVGIYGGFRVIEEMAAREACVGFWQAYAWSYGNISKHNIVHQRSAVQTVAGISVDLDESFSDDGFWNYNTMEDDEVKIGTITAKMNGIDTPLTSILYKDENYVRIRDLANAQSDDKLTVAWDEKTRTVIITSK
jgi:hypothetical protein